MISRLYFPVLRAAAVCFAVLAAALLGGAVQGQTSKEQLQDWCAGWRNVAQDIQISACTKIIRSGQYDDWGLHIAYFHRGFSYYETGRFALCIVDLTQSIKLEPNDADAYWLRHLCKKDLGDKAGADADRKMAKRIDRAIEEQWEASP